MRLIHLIHPTSQRSLACTKCAQNTYVSLQLGEKKCLGVSGTSRNTLEMPSRYQVSVSGGVGRAPCTLHRFFPTSPELRPRRSAEEGHRAGVPAHDEAADALHCTRVKEQAGPVSRCELPPGALLHVLGELLLSPGTNNRAGYTALSPTNDDGSWHFQQHRTPTQF